MDHCACGCIGSQHYTVEPVQAQPQVEEKSKQPSQRFPSFASSQAQFSGDSKRETVSKASNPPSSTPFSFGKAAATFKERVSGGFDEGVRSQAFNPASAIHQNTWSGFANRPPLSRRNTKSKPVDNSVPPKSSKRTSNPTPTPSQSRLPTTYMFVLLEDASLVDNHRYPHPNPAKLSLLTLAGLIKDITLLPSDTPTIVDQKVRQVFEVFPGIDVHDKKAILDDSGQPISTLGWRLLLVSPAGQGKVSIMRVNLSAPNVSVLDIQRAMEISHRQAPQYKKLVYIALARGSKAINIDPEEPLCSEEEGTAGSSSHHRYK
ncbi:hypothetical protein H0H93_010566, partial [Arthromyces matolae]